MMFAWLLKKNKYGKRRIVKENVDEYLLKNYGVTGASCTREKVLSGFVPLLQDDYGVNNCCSITSITAALMNTGITKNESPTAKETFDRVHKNAKLFFFGKRGTNPFMIKPIFDRTLRQAGKPGHTGFGFVKGLGVRFTDIEKKINAGTPLVFSLLWDGNGFYKDHTMLIVGVAVYRAKGKDHRFLLLHDNWAKTVSYLDYDRLPPVCSVNWYRKSGTKQPEGEQ